MSDEDFEKPCHQDTGSTRVPRQDEIDLLRAELAAERERADKAEAEFDRLSERMRYRMVECGEKLDQSSKEHDALRAELATTQSVAEANAERARLGDEMLEQARAELAERDALRAELAALRASVIEECARVAESDQLAAALVDTGGEDE